MDYKIPKQIDGNREDAVAQIFPPKIERKVLDHAKRIERRHDDHEKYGSGDEQRDIDAAADG